eukprot:scaffold41745_cov176-Amphora_coffeaeformis.AAC.9
MENETSELDDEDISLASMQEDVDVSTVVTHRTHVDSKEDILFGGRGFTKEGMGFLLKEMLMRQYNRELSIERVIYAMPDCFDAAEADRLLGMALVSTHFLQGLIVPVGDRISMELARSISAALEKSSSIHSLVLTRLLTVEVAQGQIVRELLYGLSLNRNQRKKQIRLYSLGRQEEFLEGNAGRDGIVQAISRIPGLTDVECSACSADAVATFLEGACQSESVRRVTLICDSVRDEGWHGNQRVPIVLRNLIETRSSLRELKLIDLSGASLLECVAQAMEANAALESLCVGARSTQVLEGRDANHLALLIRNCRSLKNLSLIDFRFRDEGLQLMTAALRENDSIERLALSTLYASPIHVRNLTRTGNLKELSFGLWDTNEDYRAHVLAECVSGTLETLNMRQSKISDMVARSFFVALAPPNRPLKNLEVKIENLSASSIDCLQATLRSNRSLQNLTIQCATTEGSLANAISHLFEERTCDLEALSLLDVPIGPDSLDRFFLSIRNVKSFNSLTLEDNGRGNDYVLESIHRACAHLPHLSSLKKLCYAPSVRFPSELCDVFLEAVAANTSLTEIKVGDFDPYYLEIGVAALAKRNRFRLMLVDKQTSRRLWPLAIRSLQKDESAMFECLKLVMDKITTTEE